MLSMGIGFILHFWVLTLINQSVSFHINRSWPWLFLNKEKPTLTRSCTVMSYYSVLWCWFLKTDDVVKSDTNQLLTVFLSHCSYIHQTFLFGGWAGQNAVKPFFCTPNFWMASNLTFSLGLVAFWIYTKIIFHKETSVSRLDYRPQNALEFFWMICTRAPLQEACLVSLLIVLIWILIIFPFKKTRSICIGNRKL